MKRSMTLAFAFALSLGAAQAQETVLIANVVELSGGGASNGVNWRDALELATDEINASGGLLGKKIALQSYDTQTNPGVSRAMVQKALDAKPYAIMGPIYSGSVKVNMTLAQEAKVPQFVGAQAGELTQMGNPYLFRANISQVTGMAKMADYMANVMKARRVALVWVNNDFGKGGRDVLMKEMKARGLEAATDIPIEFGQVAYTAEVTKIMEAKPDVIFPYMTAEDTARFVKEAKRQVVKIPMAGETTLLQQNVIDLAGAELEGARCHLSLTANAPDPLVQDFRKKFEARFKRTPDHNALSSYTAMYALKAATVKAGKIDSDLLARTLRGLTVTKAQEPGVLFDSSWDDKGDLARVSYIGEVTGGALKIIDTVK